MNFWKSVQMIIVIWAIVAVLQYNGVSDRIIISTLIGIVAASFSREN